MNFSCIGRKRTSRWGTGNRSQGARGGQVTTLCECCGSREGTTWIALFPGDCRGARIAEHCKRTYSARNIVWTVLERRVIFLGNTVPAVLPRYLPKGALITRSNEAVIATNELTLQNGTYFGDFQTRRGNELIAYRFVADLVNWHSVYQVDQLFGAWAAALADAQTNRAQRCPSRYHDVSCCHDAGHARHHEDRAEGNRFGWLDVSRGEVVLIQATDTPESIAKNLAASAAAIATPEAFALAAFTATIEYADREIRKMLIDQSLPIQPAAPAASPIDQICDRARETISTRIAAGRPCAWCQSSDCKTDAGSYCFGYECRLQERLLATGAHDCEEERESVRRWVEQYQASAPDLLREPAKPCSDCGQQTGALTYQRAGKRFCVYCWNETGEGQVSRLEAEYLHAGAMRNEEAHPGEALARARVDKFLKRDESRTRPNAMRRLLAQGHPASWPSTEGED